MNKVAIKIIQNTDHFQRQSSNKNKTVQINFEEGYHFQNQSKRQSSSHKYVSPNYNATDSPPKIKINQVGQQIRSQQQQVQKKEYDSPDKEQKSQRVLNKQSSLNLSQCYLSQNGLIQSKKKIEENSSMVHFHPMTNQKSPQAIGQTPKFIQNGKSIQISTINSIPNISQSQANCTVTEFGSQIFGTTNEQVNEKMIQICSQKIEEDPTNIKLYQKRLQLYLKSGNFENAIQDSQYILSREPRNIFALFSRGNALMQKGEIEKAIADFEKVLSIDPDNVNAALARASCWNIKGDYIKAIDQYEDALEKDIEKTSMLNLSINLKRNFKSTTSSQTCHLDRLEKEELQFGSDQKLNQFNSPFLEVKKLQSQIVNSHSKQKSDNPYQNLQRSQSDQVNKEQKFLHSGLKSFNGSECQSPIQDNKLNQITQQSAFSKIKSSSNTEQQDITKQTNNTDSEEKINEQANFYFTKGFCARQRKDFWKAIELYSHALSLKPDFLKAVFNRGFLFDKLGQYEKACEDYTRSIEIDEKCAFAYFNRGISLNKLKRYEKALQDFTKAIELDNTNSDFYLNRANTYQKLDMHTEAIKDYTFCIDFQTSKLSSVLISRAMSYEKIDEIERAKHDYQRAIDLGTNQAQICFSRLATIFFIDNNFQQALTLYNKALELEPHSIYCLAKRAQLYIKLELYKLASEDLTYAISIKDNIDALYYYRGKAFKLMGKLIESTEDLLHASTLNPKDPNIFRLLSKNMLDLDQYEDSINYINKEIEIIGKSKQSLFNRAFCNNKLNKFDEAEKDLKELLSEDKDNLKLQKSLSVCLLNLKKYEEALSLLNSIIQKIDKSEVSEYYKYRSECFQHLQNRQKAEEDLKMYQKTKKQN
ncbi:hypothetical protein ABPG72_011248 [Tetrahymena utriculariae]